MVEAILFDFWGTLVENGIYPSPVRQARYFLRVNIPFQDFVVKFEEAFMLKKHATLADAFQSVYDAFEVHPPAFVTEKLIGMWNKNMLLAKPFSETIKVLEELKKEYKLAIISNTDNFSLDPVLDKFDMRKYFDAIVLSYDVGYLKGNTKIFEEAMAKLGIKKKKDIIMVGDSMESDIAGAVKAKIQGILIDRKERREYEKKIKSLEELKAFIEAMK
jgi:HAD superfamily hydrolase (TIGR01493 family)